MIVTNMEVYLDPIHRVVGFALTVVDEEGHWWNLPVRVPVGYVDQLIELLEMNKSLLYDLNCRGVN